MTEYPQLFVPTAEDYADPYGDDSDYTIIDHETGTPIDESKALAEVDTMYQAFVQVRTPADAIELSNRLSAIQHYLKRSNAEHSLQNKVARLNVFTRHKAAVLVEEMPKQVSPGTNQYTSGRDKNIPTTEEDLPTLRDLGIDKNEAIRLRALAELDEDDLTKYVEETEKSNKEITVEGAVKKGKGKRKDRIRQARGHKAATAPDLSEIITGDFRLINIADNSVDLIFTDPPYHESTMYLFAELSDFAARVLKPGGVCMVYSGQIALPTVYAHLSTKLEYLWTCAIRHGGGNGRIFKANVNTGWKPVLLYIKPPRNVWWDSFIDITTGEREKDDHDWQQAESEAAYFIERLSTPNELVLDPFCGSGTSLVAAKRLGRRYIGIEVDEERAAVARTKVSKA